MTDAGAMTPTALRNIADWLDTYDDLAAAYFDLLVDTGTPADDLVRVRAATSGKEVQDDLRRWADELESSTGQQSQGTAGCSCDGWRDIDCAVHGLRGFPPSRGGSYP